FSDVVADGGDVVLKVKVTNVDGGNTAVVALAGNAGSAEISASVELFDKASKPIGAFDVKGNSKKNVQTTVGGVNTAAMDDSTKKAFEAAADEIATYLETKR